MHCTIETVGVESDADSTWPIRLCHRCGPIDSDLMQLCREITIACANMTRSHVDSSFSNVAQNHFIKIYRAKTQGKEKVLPVSPNFEELSGRHAATLYGQVHAGDEIRPLGRQKQHGSDVVVELPSAA